MKRIATALAVSAFIAAPALAGPIGVMQHGEITVTLMDEPCALAGVQLPNRATWVDGSGSFEGCFSVYLQGAAIGAFFEDGSVAVIPMQGFRPAQGV